jgi:hypothetical protein
MRVPLWVVLAACAGSAALGTVWAQAPGGEQQPELPALVKEYPYLPDRYGQPYLPSLAEWQAMRVTALGASTTRITQEFSRQHLTCFATPTGLVMTLDLLPQPDWKLYQPGGKFSAPPEKVKPDIQKAVDASLRFVRSFIPEAQDKDISLRLFIRSESVGSWEAGRLTLNARSEPEP